MKLKSGELTPDQQANQSSKFDDEPCKKNSFMRDEYFEPSSASELRKMFKPRPATKKEKEEIQRHINAAKAFLKKDKESKK